jgi:predicted AAA+ superfamily ATPase
MYSSLKPNVFAYLLASEATIEREFGSLQAIRDNFPKYVVTTDEFNMSRAGIKHLNVKEFLKSDI